MSKDTTAAERMRRFRKNQRRGVRIVRVPVSWDLLDEMQVRGFLQTSGIPDWPNLNIEDVERAIETMLKDVAHRK